MFDNKIYEGIHYSRFVISWINTVGFIDSNFKDWLRTLRINGKEIPESVIEEIYELGTNGKLELENSARQFYLKLLEGGQ